jgi:hypothetical protein
LLKFGKASTPDAGPVAGDVARHRPVSFIWHFKDRTYHVHLQGQMVFRGGWEPGHVLPHDGAGEADHCVHAEGLGEGACFIFGGALSDAFGFAVAPKAGADDAFMAEVDRVIGDGLAFEAVGDGPDCEVALLQELHLGLDVTAHPSARCPGGLRWPQFPRRGSPSPRRACRLRRGGGWPTGRRAGCRAGHWSSSFSGVGVERESTEGQAVGPGSSTR